MNVEKYKPNTEIEYDEEIVVSILTEIRKSMVDYSVHHDTIFKLKNIVLKDQIKF